MASWTFGIWVAFHISKLHVPNHDLSFEKKRGGGIGGERFFSGIDITGENLLGAPCSTRNLAKRGPITSESTRESVSAVVCGEQGADAPQEVSHTISLESSSRGGLARGLRDDAARRIVTYDARHAHQQPCRRSGQFFGSPTHLCFT